MSEGLRGVMCDLPDCMYYAKLPSQPNRAFCKHPEVHTNPAGATCPFYKMDWQRKADELANRFKKTKS